MSTKLIQYEGGGYDGCIWEWNFCLLKDNNFHDIYSSGRKAIKSKKQLVDRYKCEGHEWNVYALEMEEDRRFFADHTDITLVINVASWLLVNEGIVIEIMCDVCRRRVSVENIIGEGVVGCGGVMTTYTEKICSECYSAGTCEECNEYVGADNLVEVHGEYVCKEVCKDDVEWKFRRKEDLRKLSEWVSGGVS